MTGWSQSDAPCPACRTPLLLGQYPGVNLYGCRSCGGAWLDNDGCRRITQATLPDEISDAARTLDAHVPSEAPGYRDAARSDGHDRVCPWCQKALLRAVIAQIEVDTCTAHGTFFDRRELFALNQTFALKAASDDAFVTQFRRDLAAASGSKGNGWGSGGF